MPKIIKRRPVPDNLPYFEGVPSFLASIYAARGATSSADLDLGLHGLMDSKALKGVSGAVELLAQMLREKKRILIVGDFDCDGATSTALAVLALTAMGAKDCLYIVPNRFEYGYGLTPEIVELAATKNPDLIVTVDNGISSIEGAEKAKLLGIKVLVTDHHLPGNDLPDVDVIVNPNQPGCAFLSKNAAGVGVIFYVLSSLRSALRAQGWFIEQGIPEPNMGHYLDLVALGTVADLVPLDKNNRILVEQGLRRIRAGRCRPGILALLAIAQKKPNQIKASDMGFAIGPRLNAAGRLDDMSLGIECLLAQNDPVANEFAQQLDRLNQERKSIEQEMKVDADEQLKQMSLVDEELVDGSGMAWGLCLFEAHWHQGVIGILASRLKEKFHRPVIVFAPADDDPQIDNPMLKGSARSISGFHMRDALDLLAKRAPKLLSKFGGHAMAAGMTIEKAHFEEFSLAFDSIVRELLTTNDLQAVLYSDGELSSQDMTLENIQLLEMSGPWGQTFPEPSFDGVFEVVQSRVLKERHLKLVLMQQGETQLFDAIQFNSEWLSQASDSKVLPDKIRMVYRPNVNEFRGKRNVQFLVDHIEPA